MPKAATAKLRELAGENGRAHGTKAPRRAGPLNLGEFKDNPTKGAAAILRLRSREKVKPVLASPDFETGIGKLASEAAAESKAAVALSKFTLHPEFSKAAAPALKAAGAWPEPSKFKSADDRKLAADALVHSRPSWALPWLAKALVGTQTRFAAMRHFFASRLILTSGGLIEATEALGRDLLLDEKIVDLVTKADADAGAKLREDKTKLTKGGGAPESPADIPPPGRPDQESLLREAAWSDADEALGRALRDIGALDRSFERLASVVDGEAAERTRGARNASNFVLQWVAQAAHKRSIKALNAVGERVQFDPVLHALEDDAAPGDYVRVVKPSIVRGDGARQVVLLRGEVELE